MPKKSQIILPAGTTAVLVSDLPRLIAYALYPLATKPRTVKRLLKCLQEPSDPQDKLEELTDHDVEVLSAAWARLPQYRDGLTATDWRPYEEAFSKFAPQSAWRPQPVWADPDSQSKLLCLDAIANHRQIVANAIHAGELEARNQAMAPLPRREWLSPLAQIRLKDVEQYVAKFGLCVRLTPSPSPALRNTRWSIGELIWELGAQLAQAKRSKGDGTTDFRRDKAVAVTAVLEDVQALSKEKVISLRRADGSVVHDVDQFDQDLRLSLSDFERVLTYCRRDINSTTDYWQEVSDYRPNGRYTLRQAADQIAVEGGEDFDAILERLKSAAVNDELPVHLPEKNQRHDYGPQPRTVSVVRDLLEEAYWLDLNKWLATFEPRINYRFTGPAGNAPTAPSANVIKRSETQDQFVLDEVRKSGIDPLKMPRSVKGKPGVRSKVRSRVGQRMTDKVFKTTWQRLLDSGQIKES